MSPSGRDEKLKTMCASLPFAMKLATLCAWAISTVASLTPPVSATSWVAPPRHLTREELLAQSVGWSDAVCQAQIHGLVETARQIGKGSDRVWVPDVHLVLQPIAWLKGEGTQVPIRVGLDEEHIDRFRQMRFDGPQKHVGVFFLSRVPTLTGYADLDNRWPYSPSIQWTLNAGPYAIDHGMLALAERDSAATLKEVRSYISKQTIEAMTMKSDLIALVKPVPGATIRRKDHSFVLPVRIDEVVSGRAPGGVITLHAISPDDMPEGMTLVFLKQTTADSYEILIPAAGSHSIRNGKVKRFDLSLKAVVDRIKAVRRTVR